MSKRYIYDCDRCSAKNLQENQKQTISAKVDRRMDAAGSMDDIVESIDLCNNCCAQLLSKVIMQIDTKKFFKDIKERKY